MYKTEHVTLKKKSVASKIYREVKQYLKLIDIPLLPPVIYLGC